MSVTSREPVTCDVRQCVHESPGDRVKMQTHRPHFEQQGWGSEHCDECLENSVEVLLMIWALAHPYNNQALGLLFLAGKKHALYVASV